MKKLRTLLVANQQIINGNQSTYSFRLNVVVKDVFGLEKVFNAIFKFFKQKLI